MRGVRDHRKKQPKQVQTSQICRKLYSIIDDIKKEGSANLTRLTILKKWFENPQRLSSFGIFIAHEASRRTRKNIGEDADLLFREASVLLNKVNIFEPNISRPDAANLHRRLVEFQNERRQVKWASVRLIRNWDLLLIEEGLGIFLRHNNLSAEGYRVAADYCKNYDSRYVGDLNGPSVGKIEDIARFLTEFEAHAG